MAGSTLGTAYVQVVASAQGIKGSLTNAISGEASSAGSNAGSLLGGKLKGAMLAAGIGTALVGVIKGALAETGQLQQSYIGGLDTLYGEAADKAREYARAAQEAGISQANYSEQAVSFGAALKQAYGGDTTQALEAANKAILDMADNAAKMGTPLESIQDAYQGFAKQNYTMLDNLKLGYGGTKTEMERLLADAEKISGVHYDISNLGDVYEAIHVVQGELGLTGVAAEEAKSTLTGSFEGMKAAWDNLLGNLGLGENIAGSMRNLTDAVSNYLFNNLIPTIGNILASLPGAVASFIGTGLPQLISAGIEMVQSLATGIQQQLPTMIKSLVQGLINFTSSIGNNTSQMMSAGSKLVMGLFQGIMSVLPVLIKAAPIIISNLVVGLAKNMPKIIATGIKLIGQLAAGIIQALPTVVAAVPRIISGIRQAFTKVNWGAIGKQAIASIGKGIASSISVIKSAINKAKDAITAPIKKAVDKVKGYFPFKIGKLFSGLKLPHFSVKGKAPFGLGGKGEKPSISVSWNAKAMTDPYLFSNATLFGAGEAGDEVLYGRSALMRDISDAVGGGGATITNYITVNGADDPEDWAKRLVRQMKLEMRSA